jgi:hypothetical protein
VVRGAAGRAGRAHGVRLDGDADWAEIAELCQDAYRAIAPARLAARLDG